MIGDDDVLILPEVQPKGFTNSSPSVGGGNGVKFTADNTISPRDRLKNKSKSLGLSLRRITPDKKQQGTSTPKNYNDSGSFVSRITGRSGKSSVYTGATPVMRGDGNNSNSRGSGGGGASMSPRRFRKNNIEKQQKMEDEYYRPSMHWEEDEEEEEEVLDDGELPSLRKVNSYGSRGSGYYSHQGEERRYVAPQSNVAVAAASAAAVVSPDQLKVAGFWSQLDDNDDVQSVDAEEEPDDEKQWRRSRSPPRNRNRVSNATDNNDNGSINDGASIGLDLVRPNVSEDSKEKVKSEWNLLEKAACFANENKEEDDGLTATDRDKYAAMDEDDDDQSLDKTFLSGDTGRQTERSNRTGKQTTSQDDQEDEEDNGVLACITTALTTMCGYEVAATHCMGNDSPTKKRAHEIIEKKRNRAGGATATLVSDDEDSYADDDTYDIEEDTAIELQFHAQADDTTTPASSPKRSPKKKKKKNPINKILKLAGMKKDPPRKTLVTTTTRTGKEPSQEGDTDVHKTKTRMTDMYSSLTFEEEILGDMPGIDHDNATTSRPPASTGRGAAPESMSKAQEEVLQEDAADAAPKEEDNAEFKSEVAAMSTNEKNSYLRQLAARAKADYAASDNKSISGMAAATAAVGGAAVAVAATAASSHSRIDQQGDGGDDDTLEDTMEDTMAGDESTLESVEHTPQTTPNAEYNSFAPAEKRQFLRLLNSGMNPQDAARKIAQERNTSPPVIEEEGGDDETMEDDETVEDDNTYITDGPGEGPVTRSSRQPFDESLSRMMISDPPGVSPGVGSGESAELSAKEDDERDKSLSAAAQDSSKSSSRTGRKYAALAAIPLVPAIVRARSKSRERKRQPQQHSKQHQQLEQVEEQVEEPVEEQVDIQEQQTKEEPIPEVSDGLLSSGIGYYDARGRGLGPSEEEDGYDDSGLLDSDATAPPRGRSRKNRLLGPAAAASGLAAKVASTRSKRGNNKYRDVNEADQDEYDNAATSPRSFNLMNRNANKTSKKWNVLESDQAMDQVAPSKSAEIEGAPSWLLPRDDEEHSEDEESKQSEEDTGIEDGLDQVKGDVEEEEQERKDGDVWSPSLSPEIDQEERDESIVVSPISRDSLALSPGSVTASVPTPRSAASSVQGDKEETVKAADIVPALTPSYETDNMSYASTTTGSTWTAASKPHRRRHKGAANKRLREAHLTSPKSKGWLESIRDVASEQGQVWDPEHGWVEYTEPEKPDDLEHDHSSIGNLHLTVPPPKRKLPEQYPENHYYKKHEITELPDSSNDVQSREDNQVKQLPPTQEEDSIFDDTHTVNSLNTLNTNTASLYSTSTAPPTRRSKPKHHPSNQRRTQRSKKPIVGWKDSMENATANIDDGSGRCWNYEKGWVKADGTVDDDGVSVLTRNTYGSASIRHGEQGEGSSPGRIHIVGGDPASHLDAVMEADEDVVIDYSHSEERPRVNTHATSKTNVGKVLSLAEDDIGLPSLAKSGSDKENCERLKEANTSAPLHELSGQRTPRDPSPATTKNKRTLNLWLEKTKSTGSSKAESEDAAMSASRDTSKADTSGLSGNNSLSSPWNSNNNDSFGEEVGSRKLLSVKVVKEKCSDADSDLFEPPKFSESLANRLLHANARKRDTAVVDNKQGGSRDTETKASESNVAGETVSSRATAWMNSVEKGTKQQVIGEGESISDMDSNAPQVNKKAADKQNVSTSQPREDPPQSLDPPQSSNSGDGYIGTKKSKKADSWIQGKKDSDDAKGDGNDASATVGDLRSKFEKNVNPEKPIIENIEIKNPVFVKTNTASENDVYFRSTAMGIRLKRGEDGLVRVVSVTEATTGSSIVRDGDIDPEDRVLEAAGVDLRKPITNSQWGETVAKIRNAPRPMKFVVAAGPKRKSVTTESVRAQLSSLPPPAKYVMESRLSKSPQGQQVLEDLNASSSQDSAGGTAGASIEEDPDTEDPRKDSFFKRLTAGCAAPSQACGVPTNQTACGIPTNQADDDDKNNNDGVPMAHLQFLRTNPVVKRVSNAASSATNAASRRYPVLCGRPDTIYEEPDAVDSATRTSKRKEVSLSPSDTRGYTMGRPRSDASSSYGSQTMGTSSTFDYATKGATTVESSVREEENGPQKDNGLKKMKRTQYGSPLKQHPGNKLDDTVNKNNDPQRADSHAASKVKDMMNNADGVLNELHNVHPDDQCEI